jgi:hypothetical protein
MAALFATSALGHYSEDFSEIDKTVIKKSMSFSNPAGGKQVKVGNIWGSIHVIGYDGNAVEMEASRTILARSQGDVNAARSEVELKISENNNQIEFFVDGPFRSENGSKRNGNLPYRVNYDFLIKLPRACDLNLKTISNGEIWVENVHGEYDLNNINGEIRMDRVAGMGRIHTINGGVKARFDRNPAGNCSFSTINGSIDVTFQPDLAADCWFKTLHGSAYTSFDIQPIAAPARRQEKRAGKLVYAGNHSYGVRIGSGGPQFEFRTLNGDIRIASR